MSKQSAREIAQQYGLTRVGPAVQVNVSLAAGTGTTTLVTTAAGELFYLESIELVPGAAGDFAVRSAATAIATVLDGNAGQEYVFVEKFGLALGDDCVLNRVDSIGMSGTLTYRLLS